MIRLAVAVAVGLVAGRVWSSTARADRDDALTALAREQTRRQAAERQAAEAAEQLAVTQEQLVAAEAAAWLRARTSHPTRPPEGEQP